MHRRSVSSQYYGMEYGDSGASVNRCVINMCEQGAPISSIQEPAPTFLAQGEACDRAFYRPGTEVEGLTGIEAGMPNADRAAAPEMLGPIAGGD